jgi:PAS domain S-box-containing protein
MIARSAAAPLRTGLTFIVAPAIVLVLLAAVQLLATGPELSRNRADVAHTLDVMATAQALGRAVRDAERGQRGYLITGDPVYLAPYRSGEAAAPGLLDKLSRLTADNPEQQRRISTLESRIGVKFAELKQTIDTHDREGFDAARRIVQTDVGADAMHAIDAALDALIASENTELAQREAAITRDEARVKSITWLTGVVALGAIGLGVAVVLRAFRSLRDTEAARRASEEELRRLIDGATDYAIFMLDPTGHIRSWNAGAARIKGYRADEAIGQHLSLFYTYEDRDADEPQRALEIAAREGRYEAETWRVRKDGNRFWANVVLDAIHDDTGTLVGFAKITRDMTERRETQQTLTETRERLAQAQKMEAVGQLTGGVAHDFNNMLHVMLGSLALLERHLSAREPALLRQLEIARQGAQRAATLTRQLLAFSRRQPLQPQALDPNRLVAAMSELLRRTLGEAIAIETVLAGGMWSMAADLNQLESAILNLAINARDAMPNGGRLTIETANSHLDEAYAREHAEVTAGQYAMIAVSDTGTGMSREVVEKAFEPFFTTKGVGRGTGLGLSQVFGFVKQSGGHVKIYSEPGQGTTVKLYFPRHMGSVAAEDAPAPASVPRGTLSEIILVVEDDDAVRAYAVDMLRELGYRVLAVSDAAEALRQLESEPATDLLFSDVGLPGGMNGRELADEARRRHPGLKVLFTTAYARNAIVHQGRLDPGVELIVKPFTYDELATKLRRVLTRVADAANGGG